MKISPEIKIKLLESLNEAIVTKTNLLNHSKFKISEEMENSLKVCEYVKALKSNKGFQTCSNYSSPNASISTKFTSKIVNPQEESTKPQGTPG
mmetsp:Transcript_41553/g.36919  ORF Transcript_41553/g.36919 Transcript_41553/m.36919 type:complete len:93 (-) Transcript_41553:793-1071(-)